MDNGITFLPNDRYLLENEKFRLYYTADGEEAHNFIVVVEDVCCPLHKSSTTTMKLCASSPAAV